MANCPRFNPCKTVHFFVLHYVLYICHMVNDNAVFRSCNYAPANHSWGGGSFCVMTRVSSVFLTTQASIDRSNELH